MVSTDAISSPPALPPPPPPPNTNSFSYNPSLLIIAAILAFVCVASASIHLLLRLLSRPPPPSSPLIHRNASSNSTTTTTTTTASCPSSENDPKALLDSLPLFSLASSLAALPKSSPDCAVCLSRFLPDDQLRLLPACRHAFHSPCIDTWLRSTPSCPLCRSSIHPPPSQNPQPTSDSFRLEIGSVSRNRTPEPNPASPETGSYSLGSSFEYRVEEEVEAVVARLRSIRPDPPPGPPLSTPPPGAAVAEVAGGDGKGWLKEYVDRLASSASSSFSSLRFSSRRFDSGGRGSWDLESEAAGEDGRWSASYRWLTGATM